MAGKLTDWIRVMQLPLVITIVVGITALSLIAVSGYVIQTEDTTLIPLPTLNQSPRVSPQGNGFPVLESETTRQRESQAISGNCKDDHLVNIPGLPEKSPSGQWCSFNYPTCLASWCNGYWGDTATDASSTVIYDCNVHVAGTNDGTCQVATTNDVE